MQRKLFRLLTIVALIYASSLFADTQKSFGPRRVSATETTGLLKELEGRKNLDAINSLKSINFLLNNTKVSDRQRITLVLNRAALYVSLARYELTQNKKNGRDPSVDKKLILADADINDFFESKVLQPSSQQFGRAYLIKGIVKLYRNEVSEDDFVKSLEYDPKSSAAPWISLVIAEAEFDKMHFENARSSYLKYFSQLDPQQKSLAAYKLAWCEINTKNYSEAANRLLWIIKNPVGQDYQKDAIKDLAYVTSLEDNDVDVLRIADTQLSFNNELKAQYLELVLGYKKSRNQIVAESGIYKALLSVSTSFEQRLSLTLLTLDSDARNFASNNYFLAYENLMKLLGVGRARNLTLTTEQVKTIEAHTEKLLKAYADTYSKKILSPESIPQKMIYERLKELIAFQLAYFPKDELSKKCVALSFDLAYEEKDFDRLRNLFHDPVFSKNPKYEGLMIVALEQAKKYDEVLPLLEEIYRRDPTQANLQRLQRARYDSGKYLDVVETSPSSSQTPELLELKREASLKLAIEAKKTGDDAEYEQRLKDYLQSAPNVAKAKIARLDYFRFLLDKKNEDQLRTEILALSPAERKQDDYDIFSTALWTRDMFAFDFASAEQILPQKTSNGFAYRHFLTKFLEKHSWDKNLWSKLTADQKFYVLNLALEAEPKFLKSYYAQKTPQSFEDKERAKWMKKILGAKAQNTVKTSLIVKSYSKKFSSIVIPDPDTDSEKTYSKKLALVLKAARELPRNLQKDLAHLSASDQDTLAEVAATFEKKISEAIVNAPLPKAVNDPADIAAYREKLNNIAKEYANQAQEYQKVADAAHSQSVDIERKKKAEELPLPQKANWPIANLSSSINSSNQRILNVSANCWISTSEIL